MVKIIALREVYYANKTRNAGDEFEASDQDARILTAVDLPGGAKARHLTPNEADLDNPRPRGVQTRGLKAELPEEPKPEAAPPEDPQNVQAFKRRHYRRRDMSAEET